jgi:hypothetical protein
MYSVDHMDSESSTPQIFKVHLPGQQVDLKASSYGSSGHGPSRRRVLHQTLTQGFGNLGSTHSVPEISGSSTALPVYTCPHIKPLLITGVINPDEINNQLSAISEDLSESNL